MSLGPSVHSAAASAYLVLLGFVRLARSPTAPNRLVAADTRCIIGSRHPQHSPALMIAAAVSTE